MNTDPPSESSLPGASSPDMGRRRFARAGVVAPAVLGTLASKPVLGQSLYHCTPSGGWSGNISRPGGVVCSTLGNSPIFWIQNTWVGVPTNLIKGDLSDSSGGNSCKFTGTKVRGASFNDVFGGTYYFAKSTGTGSEQKCEFSTTAGSGTDDHPATLLEVLVWSNESDLLGREAVAALLNAYVKAPNFPVTPSRVIEMFQKAYANQGFLAEPGNPLSAWNRAQVISYWRSLYSVV